MFDGYPRVDNFLIFNIRQLNIFWKITRADREDDFRGLLQIYPLMNLSRPWYLRNNNIIIWCVSYLIFRSRFHLDSATAVVISVNTYLLQGVWSNPFVDLRIVNAYLGILLNRSTSSRCHRVKISTSVVCCQSDIFRNDGRDDPSYPTSKPETKWIEIENTIACKNISEYFVHRRLFHILLV